MKMFHKSLYYQMTWGVNIIEEEREKCKIPMLFIHGEKDTFVPFSMLDEVYNAATCDKRKLVISGANHALSAATDPDTYWSTVDEFLVGCLPAEE